MQGTEEFKAIESFRTIWGMGACVRA